MKHFFSIIVVLFGMILATSAHAQFTPITMLKPGSAPVVYCSGSNGTVCADGSVVAGTSPDGNITMYADRCELGQTWNNGNSSGLVDTPMANCTTNPPSGTGSCSTGKINSYILSVTDSDSGTAGTQNHQAAKACEDSTNLGLTDWYLPSVNEMALILQNGTAISAGAPGLTNWTIYHTSSEGGQTAHYALQANFGNAPTVYSNNGKNQTWKTFCIRNNQDSTPDAFSFTDVPSPAANTLITSNTVTITGIQGPGTVTASVTASAGTAEIRKNGGTWGTADLTVVEGDTIQVRLTSSNNAQGRFATVTVGTVSDEWNLGPVCASVPGRVCSDGTVYVGLSQNLGEPIYTMRCDGGQSWSGSACTGSALTYAWNNGTGSNNRHDTAMANCTTAPPNGTGTCSSGLSNSYFLGTNDADQTLTGTQNFNAAKYCEDLTMHGYSDWFLPSANEMFQYGQQVFAGTMGAVSYSNNQYYNTSSEYDTVSPWLVQINASQAPTTYSSNGKEALYYVKCFRSDYDPIPNTVTFTNITSPTLNAVNTMASAVTITGIGGPIAIPVSVTGDGSPQISINGGTWGTSGTIANGDTLSVRLTAAASSSIARVAYVTIGIVTTPWYVGPADECARASPTVGAVCADGSVYAGLSPDGNVPMFTTRCDVGLRWTGSVCSTTGVPGGESETMVWAPASTDVSGLTNENNSIGSPFSSVASTPTVRVTGKANSAAIRAAHTSALSYAAGACEEMSQHGRTDWYLPSVKEMEVIWNNRVAIRELGPTTIAVSTYNYWFSNEYDAGNAHFAQVGFNPPYSNEFVAISATAKTNTYRARCVRR